jgi:hypothetical protein
MSSLDQNLN